MAVSSVPCGVLPTNPEFHVYLPVAGLFRLVIGSGRSEHPRVRVGDVGVDRIEGGMVEHVGERSCEGGAEALGDLEALGKAYVLYFDAIAFERIRAGIAESSLLRYSECGRVEPRVDGPVETGIGAGDGIGQAADGVGPGGVRTAVAR